MRFHPPTSWTYPDANAISTAAYFPGQSLTQTQAQLRADGDLRSAVLAGLSTLQYPTVGITITPSYTPPMVNDCQKGSATGTATTPIGAVIGFEEGGAITKTLTVVGTALTPQLCIQRNYNSASGTTPVQYVEFIQQASVKIDGITMSEYQAQLLAAKVSSYLMLNSQVDFIEEPTVA